MFIDINLAQGVEIGYLKKELLKKAYNFNYNPSALKSIEANNIFELNHK